QLDQEWSGPPERGRADELGHAGEVKGQVIADREGPMEGLPDPVARLGERDGQAQGARYERAPRTGKSPRRNGQAGSDSDHHQQHEEAPHASNPGQHSGNRVNGSSERLFRAFTHGGADDGTGNRKESAGDVPYQQDEQDLGAILDLEPAAIPGRQLVRSRANASSYLDQVADEEHVGNEEPDEEEAG